MASKNAPSGGARAPSVFLNLPYDDSFVDLFLAYIAGLTSVGLVPRTALDIPGSSLRLDRMWKLIASCRYSVHELSPVIGSAPARLNMAFELGLVVAAGRASRRIPTWFVFVANRRVLGRSLSDLAGTDAYFHGRQPAGIFREIGNAFVRTRRQPSVQAMKRVFQGLQRALPELKRRAGTRSAFTARVFSDLRVMARALASQLAARKP